jgi:Transcriptional regulators containing a DNA-binding HTH domain and an aminotransferase domain (MocR family) and their eukaryotic orthologs
MVQSLETEMNQIATFSKPEGGMFVYVTLKKNINTRNMIKSAIKNGVAYVSGQAFTTNDTQKSSMRLNFTFSSVEKIHEGISRIKKTVDETVA